MIDTAVHMGLSREVARRLVLSTMKGTVALAIHSGQHPAQLRNDITSPGGTSASAIYESERGGLRNVIADAVWAAYRWVALYNCRILVDHTPAAGAWRWEGKTRMWVQGAVRPISVHIRSHSCSRLLQTPRPNPTDPQNNATIIFIT